MKQLLKISVILLVIGIVLSTAFYSLVQAAESPTCDIGDITDVTLVRNGVEYKRPDSRIDGQPAFRSRGPFRIVAMLQPDSEITQVKLYYSTTGEFRERPMRIRGSRIIGFIPRLNVSPGTTVFFYLHGFDNNGESVWLDEIPYTCPPDEYTQGDPYNFMIDVLR